LRNVLDHRYLLDSGFVLMTMGAAAVVVDGNERDPP
jgi:hypothetical protein